MDDILCDQLGNVTSMAAKEDQIIWAIFGVFWAANAVLLVALFSTGTIPDDMVVIVISIVGTLLSIIWFLIQRRAINWLRYYEKIINKLEKRLEIPDKLSMSPDKNKLLYCKTVGRGIRVRQLMVGSGIFVAIAWSAIFVIFLIKVV